MHQITVLALGGGQGGGALGGGGGVGLGGGGLGGKEGGGGHRGGAIRVHRWCTNSGVAYVHTDRGDCARRCGATRFEGTCPERNG